MAKSFALVSLGCPKNLVDSETFADIAVKNGYRLSDDFDNLDFVLVNTCSFIRDAIEELNRVLKEVTKYKQRGFVRKILVTGCIMKRYLKEMQELFPQVDEWIGIRDFGKFESLISRHKLKKFDRLPLTEGPYSYLKISDGCSNNCTYCTIPSIRGKLNSDSVDKLVTEAEGLAETGSRELVIIAQDTTSFGLDLHQSKALVELLKKLHKIDGFHWLRLMYLHPAHVKEELIKVIAELPKIVHSFEIPLQHCNNKLLKAMNRRYTKQDIIRIYELFKKYMPDSVFRTTFITGFPDEARKEFTELLDFITQYPFLRMGAFAYSREAGTPAYDFPGQVSPRTAVKRRNELLSLHSQLAGEYLSEYIGQEVNVLVEGENPENNEYYGRAWFDAPEIDGIVYFSGADLYPGDLVKVRIEDVIDIDLYGTYTKVTSKYTVNEA